MVKGHAIPTTDEFETARTAELAKRELARIYANHYAHQFKDARVRYEHATYLGLDRQLRVTEGMRSLSKKRKEK